MANATESIAGLATAASKGDRSALNRLAGMFYKEIFRMIYFRTLSRMDAEDLVQDVFMRMAEKLPGLKDKTLFRAWLYRIAVNRVHDFHRRNKIKAVFGVRPDSEPDAADPNPGAAPAVEQKEFANMLRSFAGRLSRWEKEIFLLRFLDELEIGEIARTLKKNENTVKTHLYRAVAKFKEDDTFRQWLKGYAP